MCVTRFVCLLSLLWTMKTTRGAAVEPTVVRAKEGSDAILPCLLRGENIAGKLFDWRKKDAQTGDRKEVFMYDGGHHYNNGHAGQDEQFRGRVSHFKDELKNGNASIIITHLKVTDSGNYTCDFPLLKPQKILLIQLVVEFTLKDRSGEISGAAPEPSVKTLDQTKDWSLLQCFVRGAAPKPQLQWQDSDGNVVPAKEPQVSERGGSYDVILQTTVTKTDTYRCVVTQEEINHQTQAETFVYITEGSCSGVVAGWSLGSFVLGAVALAGVQALIRSPKCRNKGQTSCQQKDEESSAALQVL